MDKLKLAHEFMLAMIKAGCHDGPDLLDRAWQYADAMQAEAKEREDKTRPEVLLIKDKDGKCLHFHHEFGHKKCMDCGASLEEWQPDWSKSPEWAKWWAMDADGECYWFESKPEICDDQWDSEDAIDVAPQFTYTSNWQESLRERPDVF